MTDKVQKIREEIEKRYEGWREKEFNSHSIECEIRMSECQHLLLMIDSLQEEPVSEELEEAANSCSSCTYLEEVLSDDDKEVLKERLINTFKAGAKWQKEKDQKK